jgi:RNA polymerase sigma-70 factor (ECF subfamily)
VVQHVWSTVWQQIGTLVDPERWRGWLYRMAKNAAIDAGQKVARYRRRAIPLVAEESVAGRDPGPTRAVIAAEEHRRVLDAVAGLPAIYREPFVLRHMEDWSYAQIGEALGLPVDTVETRLVRARRLLRSALQGRTD